MLNKRHFSPRGICVAPGMWLYRVPGGEGARVVLFEHWQTKSQIFREEYRITPGVSACVCVWVGGVSPSGQPLECKTGYNDNQTNQNHIHFQICSEVLNIAVTLYIEIGKDKYASGMLVGWRQHLLLTWLFKKMEPKFYIGSSNKLFFFQNLWMERINEYFNNNKNIYPKAKTTTQRFKSWSRWKAKHFQTLHARLFSVSDRNTCAVRDYLKNYQTHSCALVNYITLNTLKKMSGIVCQFCL